MTLQKCWWLDVLKFTNKKRGGLVVRPCYQIALAVYCSAIMSRFTDWLVTLTVSGVNFALRDSTLRV